MGPYDGRNRQRLKPFFIRDDLRNNYNSFNASIDKRNKSWAVVFFFIPSVFECFVQETERQKLFLQRISN